MRRNLLLLLLVLSPPACHSYEALPLDPEALRAELLALTPRAELPAAALADGLSETEAVALALRVHPRLRHARAARGLAEAEVRTAGLWNDPELAARWRYVDGYTDSISTGSFEIDVLLQPPRPGEIGTKRAAAAAMLAASNHEICAEELAVAHAVRLACAELAAAQLREQFWAQATARPLRGSGDVPRLDALFSELEAAGARTALLRARGGQREAELALRAALGVTPRAEFALQDLGAALQDPPALPPESELQRRLEQAQPELAARRDRYEVCERELELACLMSWPWPSLGPSFEKIGSSWEIGLAAGLVLPVFAGNTKEVLRLRAERLRLRAAYRQSLHAAYAGLEQALAQFASASAARRQAETETAPLLAEIERLLAAGARLQAVELRRAVDLGRKAVLARLDLVELALAQKRAWLAVHASAGSLLSDLEVSR